MASLVINIPEIGYKAVRYCSPEEHGSQRLGQVLASQIALTLPISVLNGGKAIAMSKGILWCCRGRDDVMPFLRQLIR